MRPDLAETLASVKEALRKGVPAFPPTGDNLNKAFTQGLGLTNYDLQEGALKLYAYMQSLTPIRNRTKRVSGRGDTSTKWRAITGINTNGIKLGVSEGNRGAVITTTVANYSTNYVGFGLEDYVTFEADYAATGWEDVKADAMLQLLQSYMLGEERLLFGGNASLAIGRTNTPTLAAAANGTMATAAAASVLCVGLTHDGWLNTGKGSVATGVVQTIVKTNIDGSTDTLKGGSAQPSANATVNQTNSGTGSIKAQVAPKAGEVAWAWFVGATAGAERLYAITTTPYIEMLNFPSTTQQASGLTGTDYSNDTAFQIDGLLTYALNPTSNAYTKNLQTTLGTLGKLTSDGGGGVLEIGDMLQTMWDKYRLGPQRFIVNSQEARSIYNIVIANGGAPLVRFVKDQGSSPNDLVAGGIVGSYLNPITSELISIEIHPEAVPGTILAVSDRIPYQLNGIGNVTQVKTRRDYYAQDWPLTKRRWEYGVYADETFQHFAPFSLGTLQGLSPTLL